MAPRKRRNPTVDDIPLQRRPKDAMDDIPDDEKERLIGQSGLLGEIQKIQRSVATDAPEADEPETMDLPEEIFNAILFIVPMGFLYLMMDL